VKQLLQIGLPISFSISATSRAMRQGEIDGEDYYFFSPQEFKHKIDRQEFLEWEEVYSNQYYGTLRSELDRIWNQNKHVIFDVDVIGGLNIKKQFQDKALSVFIMPPSLEELKHRLQYRGTETEESLQKRLQKAEHELSFAPKFDKVVLNDNLERAVEETYNLVKNFIEQ
ncbi:MAG: guanylate kinase, partial [Bacteroidales bacterium]|nr:guanylate kinase [Bacteroidales bacterium]